MYRVTTPTYTFNIPFDAEDIEDLRLTFRQNTVNISLGMDDITLEDRKITVTLNQEQTKDLRPDICEVQLRVKLYGGSVCASNIVKIKVKPVLNEEIL